VTYSTLSGNTGSSGGGIFNFAALILSNSIVAGNSAHLNYADIDGSYSDYGGNQASSNSSSTSTIAIHLALLANYGGPTPTMLPLPGSPAICAGLAGNIVSGWTDQRGFANTNTTYTGYILQNPCVDAGAVQTNYQSVQFTNAGSGYTAAVNQPAAP